jgi:ligand-binding sensor protein
MPGSDCGNDKAYGYGPGVFASADVRRSLKTNLRQKRQKELDMTLFDITPKTQWQRILDQVSTAFEIQSILADTDGKILLNGGNYNPLCSKVRADTESSTSICSQSHSYMFKQALEKGGSLCGYCEIGLFKAMVPIFWDGVTLGALSACGVAVLDEPIERFLITKMLHIDEQEADELIKEVPVFDAPVVERICAGFERFIRGTVDGSLKESRLNG